MKRWYYWIKTAFYNLLLVAMMSLIYGFLLSVVDDDGFSGKAFASLTLCYGLIIWLIMTGAVGYSKLITMINISLSMGETRKNIFLGINIMNITGFCSIMAILFIAFLTSTGSVISLQNALLTFPSLAVLASGFGMLLATLKKDNSSSMGALHTIFYIVGVLSITAASFLTGMLGNMGGTDEGFLPFTDSFYSIATTAAAITGILLYTLSSIRMKRMLSIYEARL